MRHKLHGQLVGKIVSEIEVLDKPSENHDLIISFTDGTCLFVEALRAPYRDVAYLNTYEGTIRKWT